MTDEQVVTADPSPAAVVTANPLESLNEEQRGEWLKSGKLPEPAKEEVQPPSTEAPPKTADSAPAKDKSDQPPEADAGKVPDVGKHVTAEERKAQLAADIQESLKQRKELREEVERLQNQRKDWAAPLPAAAAPAAAPQLEDFDTVEAFEAATIKFHVQEALAKDRKEHAEAVAKADVQRLNTEIESTWKERTAASAKVHTAFADILNDNDLVKQIVPGSLLDATILHRPEGAEIFYYLGKNRSELDRILKLSSPLDQAFELAAIEQKIVQGRVPVKRVTGAPPPPTEVAGKATSADDEVERAAKDGDFSAYAKAANAKDIAARKK